MSEAIPWYWKSGFQRYDIIAVARFDNAAMKKTPRVGDGCRSCLTLKSRSNSPHWTLRKNHQELIVVDDDPQATLIRSDKASVASAASDSLGSDIGNSVIRKTCSSF
jgi:hypothetical protein